ncbi:beta-ketoacyl synthase N-terminal-like domain-containing protein [Pseudomonas sp. SBB6]|uniref:beta-ketoacyl synthase N-terminal-like domain-containing protein n=1 Tax=Pseudomonas sp. SBB6 TaxID=2962032 RepID=UPI0020B65C8D|nr:beta-ketoacyl synthase N-terminal-like domain-containing protein [Pseudomonas sp. SBB6]MCP3751633.1 phosphopantetheine-binding protein [Pseudomonas sp. SBB6]
MTQQNDSRALMENALRKIKRLNHELAELDSRQHEAIAIVGIGCRFPGADSGVEQFWNNLCEGVDSVSPLTDQRWDQQRYFDPQTPLPGKTYSPSAGLLDDVLRFDAELFGITPREAECMDPQQRILLEVTWQALEDAGMAPDTVRGANAGVFTGIMNKDHSDLLVRHLGLHEIAAHMNAGNHESVHSGRVSYTFDFKGPCITLNTACSSSLVSVHLACQSLRQNECDFALAGGCNVILAPATSIAQSQAMMHSPQGQCKAFDAAANGYVRAEGCGVLVLKRLSRAIAEGDRIYAVIRGSAVNQDGLSQGIMAPNGPAQVRVIRSALENARVAAKDVAYVEAHGTGTKLGDPIELQALGSVYGRAAERAAPLLVGSLKTNIGHSESAAGVAGIIKVAKALQQGLVPPQLHFHNANPFVDLNAENIRICVECQAWPGSTQPSQAMATSRLAGVSSFGFSGTNAHIIMESYSPPPHDDSGPADLPHLLCISAREDSALKTYAGKLLDLLAASDDQAVADLCYSQNSGRRPFDKRIAVSGSNRTELVQALQRSLAGEPAAVGQHSGAALTGWVIGNLDQHSRIHYQRLFQRHPAFSPAARELLDSAQRLLARDLSDEGLEQTHDHRDLRLFDAALFYGVATLWRSLGIEPRWILAQGAMAPVAAAITGSLTLHQAITAIDSLPANAPPLASLYASGSQRDPIMTVDLGPAALAHALASDPVGSVLVMGQAGVQGSGLAAHPGTRLVQVATTQQEDAWATLAATLAALYQAGAAINPAAWDQRPQRRKQALPTYAFQGRRYWLDPLGAAVDDAPGAIARPQVEPALVAPASMNARDYVTGLIRLLAKMDDQPLPEDSLLIDDIGFDSLMLAELRTRVEKAYPNAVKIPLDLLHTGSLAELLSFVESAAGNAQAHSLEQGSDGRGRALAWLAKWKDPRQPGQAERMDKRHVHKACERNVLLGDIAAIDDSGWYAAELFHDAAHPFFYEHAQDHVPGLYLIEAARQFGIACSHLFQGVPHEFPFVLDDMRIRFDAFAEQDSPVYLLAEYTDLMFKDGHLHRSHSRCHIVQHGNVLGTIEGHGLILQPADYRSVRTLESAL